MDFDKNIAVKELMTTNAVTVFSNDLLVKVEAVFNTYDFHHIPVISEDGEVLGIISKSDFYRMQDSFTFFDTAKSRQVNHSIFQSIVASEIMAKPLVTLSPDDTALKAMSIFRENLFHALPVVDENRKLLGILTTFDLLVYAYQEPAFATFTKE